MKWITFRDFLKRCRLGFIALVIAAVVFGIAFGTAALQRDTKNIRIQVENEQALVEWAKVNQPVNLKNATIQVLRAGKTSGHTPFDSADYQALGRFVDLVLLVANGKTAEARIQAYCKDFLKTDQLPDATPYGVYRALATEDMRPLERYDLLRSHRPQTERASDFMIVDGLIRTWLKGDKLELEKLPEQPAPKPLETRNSKAWIIFALILFGIANIRMAWGYNIEVFKDEFWLINPKWALPANPAGWLIMILFAPAFAVPWVGRAFFWIVLYPIGLILKGIKWTLFDLDLSAPPRKVREWREARREQARRKMAEEQVRIAEQAALGHDVISARLKLGHIRELVAREKNPALRKQLKRIEQRLEAVAQARRSKQVVRIEGTDGADDLAGLVDDLHMQVEGLEEAEELDGSSTTV
jgi:hypothetical protein